MYYFKHFSTDQAEKTKEVHCGFLQYGYYNFAQDTKEVLETMTRLKTTFIKC